MTNDEIEIIFPIESLEYPGFYHIPNFKEILINKEGIVKRLLTGNNLSILKSDDGYLSIGVQLRSVNGEKRKKYRQRIHRLLALTFIGRPKRHWDKPFEELEVNHIDGVKSNNFLINLEWCTHVENLKHARDTFLSDHNIPVLAKHVKNGNIMRFINMEECIKYFNISSATFSRHINGKDYGTLTFNWHVFKLDNSTQWPIVNNNYLQENTLNNKSTFTAFNILTKELFIENNFKILLKTLNIHEYRVRNSWKENGKDFPYKNFIFKPLNVLIKTI